jgi:hypothetical protein
VYTGAEPDPFRSAPKSATHHTTTSTGSTSATGSTSRSGTTTTTGSRPPSSSGTSTGSAPRATAQLADDQAYAVDFATTDANVAATVKNAERVAPLPASAPQIVYVGVLRGGKRAVFVVLSPNSSLATSGTAQCFPQTGNCEVLGSGASVTLKGAAGSTYTLRVSSITAKTYPSNAAAAKARRAASKAGEQLVSAANPKALANFFYALGIGAVLHRPAPS